jgi:predicted dehydrogenase
VRVKIVGAGSIGNHMAKASRELGWDVTVVDISRDALARMRDEIYPGRYGAWDPAIQLRHSDDAITGDFDVVIIGTPPDHHLTLAMKALSACPKAILIEKPLCPPSLEGAQALFEAAKSTSTKLFVGYDHVVGRSARAASDLIRADRIGDVLTIDVEFREHWAGIFKAHPWLAGPHDSYLGFFNRGGGAGGEHSHALNLWQHFAHVAGAGRVRDVNAMMRFSSAGQTHYDEICLMTLRTETGMIGRVVQDVVTLPPRKRATIQGTLGSVEWINGYDPSGDAVMLRRHDKDDELSRFPKRRVDDFIEELRHVADHLDPGSASSDIGVERGLDTALVLAAAHRSEQRGRLIRIDYGSEYSPQALVDAGEQEHD